MNTRTLLAIVALAAVLVVPSVNATSVSIKGNAPAAGDYTMNVDVSSDFTLVAPTAPTSPNAAHTGHIHYFVNGKPCQDSCAAGQSYATAATSFTFHGLAKGDTVSAELVNNDHSSLAPMVKDSKTVTESTTKSSPAVGPLFALGLLGLAGFVSRRQA